MLVNIKEPSIKRCEIPHEPGQWIEIKRLAWRVIPADKDPFARFSALFVAAITAWSYPEPVTRENIETMDDSTASWLLGEISAWNHPARTAEQQRDAI